MRDVQVVRVRSGLEELLSLEPALRALRAWRPDAHVELLGTAAAAWLAARGLVDSVQRCPVPSGISGVHSDPRAVVRWLAQAQLEPADVVLQLHGPEPAAAAFVELLGASRTAGFAPAEMARGAGWLTWRSHECELIQLQRPLAAIGCAPVSPVPRFPLTSADVDAASALYGERGFDPEESYVVIHPGCSHAAREWPAARHAALARVLTAEGIPVIVTGGASDRELANRIVAAAGPGATSVAGETPLGTLAGLIRLARVTVCSDPGITMLADAVDARSVSVLRDVDVRRWLHGSPDRRSVIRAEPPESVVSSDVACEVMVQLLRGIEPFDLVRVIEQRLPA